MMMMMILLLMLTCLQPGFYGLSVNNIDGCLPCDCDIGGSRDSLCDVTSAQCMCRDHVIGRTCRQPMSRALTSIQDPSIADYFIPTMSHLTFEAEHATTLDNYTQVVFLYFCYFLFQSYFASSATSKPKIVYGLSPFSCPFPLFPIPSFH